MSEQPKIDWTSVHLEPPYSGFSCLHIGPYKIGIAITTEGGKQDPEAAAAALEDLIRRARADALDELIRRAKAKQ